MKNKKQKILVSTDSIGFFGSSKEFLYLWQDYFEKKFFDGVEMIGLKPLFKAKKFIRDLKQKNINVISIHGQTGIIKNLNFFKKSLLRLINFFIFDYQDLRKNFPNQEFLFHSVYLENKNIQNQIIKNPPLKLWIENSLTDKNFQELEKTLKLVDFFQKKGINCSGMIDLYHALSFNQTQEIVDNWFFLFKKLKKYLKYFSGIHLPIGPRLDDALPLELVNDEKIDYLKKEILSGAERIVIENPQEYLALVFSTSQMLKKQKQRNERILKKLFF
ncbi:MAG: hypothetical protein N2593_04140 [Patescibacteria group bacterium]|nr:hypothetical protein [Patescibacteria group bacterium]